MIGNGLIIPAATAFSYVLGSVPTGLWLGLKLRNIDIREHGSRNIGATNTLRVLGRKLGIITLAMDVLKGWLPVAFALWLGVWDYLPILCGLAAILGHTFSLFLRFRGGKGVATSTGVFLGLAPLPSGAPFRSQARAGNGDGHQQEGRACADWPGLGDGFLRLAVRRRADRARLLEVLAALLPDALRRPGLGGR